MKGYLRHELKFIPIDSIPGLRRPIHMSQIGLWKGFLCLLGPEYWALIWSLPVFSLLWWRLKSGPWIISIRAQDWSGHTALRVFGRLPALRGVRCIQQLTQPRSVASLWKYKRCVKARYVVGPKSVRVFSTGLGLRGICENR